MVVQPSLNTSEGRGQRDSDCVGTLYRDDDEKEILLVVASRRPRAGHKQAPMTVGQLVRKLQAWQQDCGDYRVEATSSKPKGSDLIRLDFPIHGLEVSHEAGVCALLWL